MWIGDALLSQLLMEELQALYPDAYSADINSALYFMRSRTECAMSLTSLGLAKYIMYGTGATKNVSISDTAAEAYEALLGGHC